LRVPAPLVRLDEFKPTGAQFFARAFFTGRRVREMWNLASEIRISIVSTFKKEGIKIPYPQRVVSLLQGERSPFDPKYNNSNDGINIRIIEQDETQDVSEKEE